jgi:predicted membrane-bound spermidine synthase
MIVDSREKAWMEADKIFPTDYTLDSFLSSRSGYNVFVGAFGDWISDLGTRLEVNFRNGKSVNIFIDEVWE